MEDGINPNNRMRMIPVAVRPPLGLHNMILAKIDGARILRRCSLVTGLHEKSLPSA